MSRDFTSSLFLNQTQSGGLVKQIISQNGFNGGRKSYFQTIFCELWAKENPEVRHLVTLSLYCSLCPKYIYVSSAKPRNCSFGRLGTVTLRVKLVLRIRICIRLNPNSFAGSGSCNKKVKENQWNRKQWFKNVFYV